jgi:hypothetical protein
MAASKQKALRQDNFQCGKSHIHYLCCWTKCPRYSPAAAPRQAANQLHWTHWNHQGDHLAFLQGASGHLQDSQAMSVCSAVPLEQTWPHIHIRSKQERPWSRLRQQLRLPMHMPASSSGAPLQPLCCIEPPINLQAFKQAYLAGSSSQNHSRFAGGNAASAPALSASICSCCAAPPSASTPFDASPAACAVPASARVCCGCWCMGPTMTLAHAPAAAASTCVLHCLPCRSAWCPPAAAAAATAGAASWGIGACCCASQLQQW